MIEGPHEGYVSRSNPEAIPESGLTPDELVAAALEHNLSDEAAAAYAKIFEAGILNNEDLASAIDAFNALSAKDRGEDHYNHERPLTEAVDSTSVINTPNGKGLEVTLAKNGTITVKSPLNS